MKQFVERRKPQGIKDYISIALTTFGVGYLPIAPGTWGSMVGVAIYFGVFSLIENIRAASFGFLASSSGAQITAAVSVGLIIFTLIAIWASDRSIELLGNSDPSEAVVDEVIGQLITFLFVPFGISWGFILAGFLLFRLFDIWKPYPIDSLQVLNGGLGICADDIVAGVYAGICLAVVYAIWPILT